MTSPEPDDALYRAMVDDGIIAPDAIAAGQAAELPGKRAEDAGWAVVVPDEAVRLAGEAYARSRTWPMYDALVAAAPAIVAANQPAPLPEVQCPNCDATIRARMADQVEGDLREVLRQADVAAADVAEDQDRWLDATTAPVQSYVDAQVAAARADERARIAQHFRDGAEAATVGPGGRAVALVIAEQIETSGGKP